MAGEHRPSTNAARVGGLLALVLALLAPGATLAQAPASDPLADAAMAYALYQDDVSWIARAEIDSAARVDEALDRAARTPPRALVRGWIAYGALAATQSPAFVAGVRARVRSAGRAPVLRRLAVDLSYARNRPQGSAQAVQVLLRSAVGDAARIDRAGTRLLALGDTLQAQDWARETRTDRAQREARMRALPAPAARPEFAALLQLAPGAAAPLTDANAFGGSGYWTALIGLPADPPVTRELRAAKLGLVDRMLTLAAYHIAGAPAPPERFETLLADESTESCLSFAQLQFRQCASVTQFPYENAFCLARHGLSEPSGCVAAVAR